tara:strand:+ start:107 stop:421 length:315 start_codon:yes stop_codon:yes gene_type:complete
MTNSLSGGHSEKEKEHKERIKKLKARTSKMRVAVSTFKPSAPKKPYKLTKTDKKRQKEFGDFVVQQEKNNEEVRKKFNKKFYPGGNGAKPEPSYFTPSGARRTK